MVHRTDKPTALIERRDSGALMPLPPVDETATDARMLYELRWRDATPERSLAARVARGFLFGVALAAAVGVALFAYLV